MKIETIKKVKTISQNVLFFAIWLIAYMYSYDMSDAVIFSPMECILLFGGLIYVLSSVFLSGYKANTEVRQG